MKFTFLLLLIGPTLSFGYKIYAPERIQSKPVQAYNNEVILDSYRKIGIKPELIYITEEEINTRLKSGDFDAVMSKIDDKSVVPNSLKINPPVIENYEVIRVKIKGKPTVKTKIVAGALKGVLAHTKGIIKNRKIFKEIKYYQKYQELFSALQNGEVDSVLLTPLTLKHVIADSVKGRLEVIPGALARFNINHYINKKHKLIKPKIENEFLKRDQKKEFKYTDFLKNNLAKKKGQ